MSLCIILVRHQKETISSYMGKLRFTLTNIIIWIVLLLSCLLAENFALMNSNPLGGFSLAPAYILTISTILFLVFYYLLEHKKNGLTFDKILLPSFIMMGIIMIWTIFRQDSRTFTDWEGTGTFDISFTFNERMLAALQVVIWLGLLYALVFVYNRFRLNKESYRWIAKVYLIVIVLLVVIDFFYEWDIIAGIFMGTYTGSGVQFLMGNANVWGLMIFTGIVSALILLHKRFTWYYFAGLVGLFLFLIFTTSATAIYISLVINLAYPIYEIFIHYKENKKQTLIKFAIYMAAVLTTFGICVLLVVLKVPMFVNFYGFVDNSIFHKDFLTVTGRTIIWDHIFDLLKANPLDFIFGLGHVTGPKIFQTYNASAMPVKSAHNGVMEFFLRYGLLGAITYVGVLGLVVFSLIQQLRRKNYRFVFIYGLAFVSVVLHSIAESTMMFTPNVGGVFFGFVVALPILNVLQEKRLTELKEDLLSVEVKKEPISKNAYIVVLVSLMMATIVAIIIRMIASLDIFSTVLILLAQLAIGAVVLVFTNNKALAIINNNILYGYQMRVSQENNNEK